MCAILLIMCLSLEFHLRRSITFLTLIPKVKHVQKIGDLRPISLCKVIYKIVAKILANRLKAILPSIISPQQSVFVPSRLISNNIIISYEVLHSFANRVKEKYIFMVLKLDISKVYEFLELNMNSSSFFPAI